MGVLAFVLFWIVIALALVLLAMRGGPRRARGGTEPRRGRRGGVLLFVLSILVLGVAIPAAVIAGDKSRDSIPEASVRQLTPEQERGRALFGRTCRQCHTLKAANANGGVGPNLDALRPPEALVLDAIQKGRARGNGNMPANVVEGSDAKAVASFVAAAVGTETNR